MTRIANWCKKLVFVWLLIVFLTFINASFALALEVNYPSVFGLTITNNSSIIDYAKYFFNLGMLLAGVLALGVIAFGGFNYLISAIKGGFASNAKEWIKSGVVGLLILLSTYLIAYTINPDLVVFRLEELFPILSKILPPGTPQGEQVPTTYYKEIPIGIATENLVSRTMDCYDFDAYGDPIEGERIQTGNKIVGLPTYLDHDRVDCYLKLADAVQKKTKVFKQLSDKIIELMEQCSCEDYGQCGLTCQTCVYEDNDCPVKNPNKEGLCSGDCIKAPCAGNNDCCPPGVRKKIEGDPENPIEITDCQGNIKKYLGLSEFRTSLSSVSSLIEFQVSVNGKVITVIDKTKWQNLKMVEQLMYFKEKLEQIKSAIQLDQNELKNEKSFIASCYDVKSSADLLKIKENTDKTKKTIGIQRVFVDPVARTLINPNKYCQGFNYSNSDCFKKCQDKCPDATIKTIACYGKCPTCKINDKNCLAQQQTCVEKCYNERDCIFSGSQGDSNFITCIDSCKTDCSELCSKKYLYCSDQFKICQDQCSANSQCLLDNESTCLVNGKQFQECAVQNINNDPGNIQNCIDGAYLCKYGSNEYAGYSECLKAKNPNEYSSPYIFVNQGLLKCPNPYAAATGEGTAALCVEVFNETAKCPPNSKCPKCPCGLINQTLVFSDKIYCPPGECLGSDGICSHGNCGGSQDDSQDQNQAEDQSEIQISIKKYVLVTGECSQFAYNNDPLTFYCRVGWEPEAPLSGRWSSSSKVEEIPVGQTIDDTLDWADDLQERTNQINNSLDKMMLLIEKIGKAKDYCQCNSKYEDEKPICHSNCQFSQTPLTYPNGEPMLDDNGNQMWSCECSIVPCHGNPCQQMIDYLKKISKLHNKIRQAFIDFYAYFIVSEKRTDVLKELTYSRKQMNDCSQQLVRLSQDVATTLNCTRAYGNNFVEKRCYGILEGQTRTPKEVLADNWFCPKRGLK